MSAGTSFFTTRPPAVTVVVDPNASFKKPSKALAKADLRRAVLIPQVSGGIRACVRVRKLMGEGWMSWFVRNEVNYLL